jgi:hypothetical protein
MADLIINFYVSGVEVKIHAFSTPRMLVIPILQATTPLAVRSLLKTTAIEVAIQPQLSLSTFSC